MKVILEGCVSEFDAFDAGGNLRLVAAMAEGLPIFYNSIVSRIQYAEDGVMVQAGGRSFKGNRPPPPSLAYRPTFLIPRDQLIGCSRCWMILIYIQSECFGTVVIKKLRMHTNFVIFRFDLYLFNR